MSQASTLPKLDLQVATRELPLLAGVALASFAALLLELAWTRLFSVVLFYHYAFLAISLALLGLGAGAVIAHLARERLRKWSTRSLGTGLSLIHAIAVVIVLEIILHTSVTLDLSGDNLGRLTILYLSSAIPFLVTGVLLSVVFARHSGLISRLYAADLTGGALACLAAVPLLNHFGGPNTVLFSSAAMAMATVVWTEHRRSRLAASALLILLLIAIQANSSGRLLDITYAKGQRRDRAGLEYARWNAISRVEVDRHDDGSRWITIDADAATAIMNVDPHQWAETDGQDDLMSAAPAVINILRPHGDFAIIGPGGGVDVVRALANGSPKVTAIEINRTIVNEIMRGRYADFARHLYQIPEVDIHVSDGRSFLRSSHDKYDVVQMTLVDTWAATAAGAFALSENNLYTVEAFKEYFEHLEPEGMIAITRWEFKEPREALRVVSVAIEALHQLGVVRPQKNFIVVSDGPLDVDGRPVLVVAKRSPFTEHEEEAVWDHIGRYPNLVFQYAPSRADNNAFFQLISSNDPWGFARHFKFNVAPVDDNTPFFFFTLKLAQVLGGVGQGMDWKVNRGVAVLLVVLVLSILAVLSFLILPMALRGGRSGQAWPLAYFVAVGLGYILVEVSLIQRLVLFLGHPTYALTVVIFLLLLSSGAGSLVSRRSITRSALRRLPLPLIVTTILVYVFLLPVLLPSLGGVAFPLKLITSGALLIPLGFIMGMPFPTGLRALASGGSASDNSVEWAWAMNAGASVLGSVLATVIAVQFGLNLTLASGATAYLAAIAVSGTLQPKRGG